MLRVAILLFIFSFSINGNLSSQPVFERHTHEVNNYLSRLAQKGLVEWNDNLKPLRMDLILAALDFLALQNQKLSSIEKKELAFYQSLYKTAALHPKLRQQSPDFSYQLFPVVSGQIVASDSINYFKRSIGVNVFGSISKRWGYQLSFQDVTEKGSLLDTSKQSIEAAMETGYVKNSLFNNKNINYTEIRAHLSYAFKKGMVSTGQDYLTWGYGKGGQVVLSDKAPADAENVPGGHFVQSKAAPILGEYVPTGHGFLSLASPRQW